MFSPNKRVAFFFFVQSLSVGLANSFAGIWFDSRGISTAQIGILNAMPVVILLFSTVVVGKLADKARDWRQVIIYGSVLSASLPLGLFWSHGFVPVLAFWSLAVVAQWAIVPVADAAALRMSRRTGADFGTFRAFGTIGYLLTILCAGYAIKIWGIQAFLPGFVLLCGLRALAALGLPHMRATSAEEPAPTRMTRLSDTAAPTFLLPLLAWALIYSTHLVLNGFQGLLWNQQGLSTDLIGILIALGAVAETAMFFAYKHVAKWFSPLALILLAAVFSVVRWSVMAASPGVEILVITQLLHAFSYALGFLACTNFIADGTDESIAAQAQSLLVMLEQGVAIFVLLAFGWLAGLFGAGAYLMCAIVAALGGGLIIVRKAFAQPTTD